jgi:membrane-associated phospholipid phosphatase
MRMASRPSARSYRFAKSPRLRALTSVVALEAALLVGLLDALGNPDRVPAWLVVLLTVLMPVSLLAAAYLFQFGRSSRLAESLGRPFPRAFPILLLAALGPMYMVIAVLTPGRTLFMPELALDRAVPLQPPWVLVYWSQWVFSFLPVFVVRGYELRRRAVLAYLTIVTVSYVGFLLYPTLGPRPAEVVGDGFFVWSLRELYGFDPPYNCFPSLHVAYSFLAALTAYRVHRTLGLVSLFWAALIAVSTLYTKQHYIVDVLAGILLAYGAYAVFLRRFPRAAIQESDRLRAPMRALVIPAIFAVMVSCFWVAYETR